MRTCARFCVVALLTSGCAHFQVAPAGTPPSTPPQTRHVHALFWGAREPRITPDNCNGQGLSSVTVKITAVDVMATVVTFGFWAPVTIEWTCAKPSGGVK